MGDDAVRHELLVEYGKALREGYASLFLGAGISVAAGYPTWRNLLEPSARKLGVAIEEGTELVELAQFIENRGTRERVDQLIMSTFREERPIPQTVETIAGLPVTSIWTTNYDTLVERAFAKKGKLLDIKVQHGQLTDRNYDAQAVLYKLHGSIGHSERFIITKEDFELYPRDSPGFVQVLSAEYINKMFLFLGLSFKDPNVNYLLAAIRSMFRERPPKHYAVMQCPQPPAKGASSEEFARHRRELNRFELWTDDMVRYGMNVLSISDFDEILQLLVDLDQRYYGTTRDASVYVNGSFDPTTPARRKRVEDLCARIGAVLARKGKRFVSGLGLVVGPSTLRGFVEALPEGRALNRRLLLRSIRTGEEGVERRRTELIGECATCILIGGGNGTWEDVRIARSLRRTVVPIPGTHGTAEEAAAAIRDGTDVDATEEEKRLVAELDRAGFSLDGDGFTDIEGVIAVLEAYFARTQDS